MLKQLTTQDLINGFHAWVDKQPKDKAYDYIMSRWCAFALYMKDIGFPDAIVGGYAFHRDSEHEGEAMPYAFAMALIGDSKQDHTYGQLSLRLTAAGY